METVAIFGVGLIGGSFALALRSAGFGGRILGVSSQRTLERAIELGAIDGGCPLEEACAAADLIFLAQPIGTILETLTRLNPRVREATLVTDAGSTKAAIVEAAARHLTRCQFLGGHPLAGKESRGVGAAAAGLFKGRTWALTPRAAEEMETPAARDFLHWIGRIGASPVTLDAISHDRVLAYTSHLPQLASTALAAALGAALGPEDVLRGRLFGPALLDSTRLALSPFGIWKDIVATNRKFVQSALECYIIELQRLIRSIESDPERGTEEQFLAATEFSSRIRGS